MSLHWLSAHAILALLVGFRAADAADPAAKAELLRLHVPPGITVLALTVLRLLWWGFVDRKPRPVLGTRSWQARLAGVTHGASYLLLLVMLCSGIALMALSRAGDMLFGGAGTLPDFSEFVPRAPHGIGAMLLVILFLLHAGAALYHQFIRRDGILRRMWYGRGNAVVIAED